MNNSTNYTKVSSLNDIELSFKDQKTLVIDQHLDADTIISILDKIIKDEAEEYSKNTQMLTANIVLKGLSSESLVVIYKHLLECDNLVNSSLILNILNLIKMYNAFDDSFFAHELIHFKDLEQFLDVKLELKAALEKFINRIGVYYLSIMSSAHKTTYTYLDQPVELPYLYKRIILSSDFIILSGILSKCKTLSTNELYIVKDAYMYLAECAKKMQLADALLNLFVSPAKLAE